MALKIYKNKITGEERKSLKQLPPDEWDVLIVAPNQKFMVAANKGTGTSKIKDSDKSLKARARNHSRDVLGDETIQMNLDAGSSRGTISQSLLNEKGQKRRKIDDI
jgi:hypothetical protein